MLRPMIYVYAVLLALVFSAVGEAASYRVEILDEAPPSRGLSPEIAGRLQPRALRIRRGKRLLCDIWLCKQWPIKSGFEPTAEILYPFEEGELIGAVRYHRKGGDFRDQEIEPGIYTLRYALQPVDGDHVGTSDTRDFVLLSPAKDDQHPDPLDEQDLIDMSVEASGTSHPALLSMLAVREKAGDLPTLRHDEDRDLWSLRASGKAVADGKANDLVIEFVVVGQSEL